MFIFTVRQNSRTKTQLPGRLHNTTGDPVFDETLRRGLAVQLEQSPFLRVVSEARSSMFSVYGQTRQAKTEPISSSVGLRAYRASRPRRFYRNAGASTYWDCAPRVVAAARRSLRASGGCHKERCFDALGQMASTSRSQLGESLVTVEQHSTPLAEATTPSLEALKAYSLGRKTLYVRAKMSSFPCSSRQRKTTRSLPWLMRPSHSCTA